jgi:deoxyribose-phosphate aldolase
MTDIPTLDPRAVARLIDHTLLKADGTAAEVTTLCEEALFHRFASVCVNPGRVPLAARCLADAGPDGPVVCTVIGFPLGANQSDTKAYEAELAVTQGATEVDMVLNIGLARDGDWKAVESDIAAVVRAAQGRLVKVILETCLLTNDQIVTACKASVAAGAHFVKTSTGFSKAGATVEHIRLMRATVGSTTGVKASGGVRTLTDALAMIQAGASRIGTSNGVAIVSGIMPGETGY